MWDALPPPLNVVFAALLLPPSLSDVAIMFAPARMADAAQVAEIRRALRANGLPREVEVRTVDGFQGREKEVILFSAVRANRKERLGFLTDKRRLNVGLTRARRALLVVGCQRTLRADATWHAFLEHCSSRGLMLSAEDLADKGVVLADPKTKAKAKAKPTQSQQESERQTGGGAVKGSPLPLCSEAANDAEDEDEILMKEAAAV